MTPILWALFGLVALVLVLVALVVIIRGPQALAQLLTPAVRRWLYGVATAALVLLAGYGVVTDHLAALWSLLFAALFDVARQNVPSSTTGAQEADEGAYQPQHPLGE